KRLAIAALLIGVTVPTLAQAEPKEFGCHRILEDSSGKTAKVREPSFSILELTRGEVFTPPPLPQGLTAVAYYCERSELVPAVNDWKVFEAGAPLMIVADVDGTSEQLMLELDKGR